MAVVTDTFSISGRGTVVVLSVDFPEVPIGRRLSVRIERPDGSAFNAVGWKERTRRLDPTPTEGEAFLLMDVEKKAVPIGSEVEVSVEV